MLSIRTLAGTCAAALCGLANAATYVDVPVTGARDHAFGPNGMLYITAGAKLHRYDTATCQLLPPIALGQQLVGVDVSIDGRFVAVADRAVENGKVHVYVYDGFGSRLPRKVEYPADFGENGSFMVAWMADSSLLISGSYSGSGWVPLRRYEPTPGTVTTIGRVQQNSMLAASRDGMTAAIAESNISSGPVHAWDLDTTAIGASARMNWFAFEAAIDANGSRIVSPSYNGAYVYERVGNQLVETGRIGQYAEWGPLSAVFSPDAKRLVTADYGWSYGVGAAQRGVKIYDADSLTLLSTIDPYPFPWNGNHALGQGRLTLSRDGHWLAATINGAVRLYDVHEELGTDRKPVSACATKTPSADSLRFERGLVEEIDRLLPRKVDAMGQFVE
ncbi:WD40 repeat domain-containing protein [Tahibacter amnicola]|uniref:Uncharacterized protein n=1 Tax=Tahibacter amnicola TaxID=2976241 RepID=A0ABY6BFQ7_9GAMM|nr:hypothetical protein [Tahibacter amnicola]UXI67925.1 hypothetical protein N4264_24885 [Tahibacter amnicola]